MMFPENEEGRMRKKGTISSGNMEFQFSIATTSRTLRKSFQVLR
jgi:hypothetical protein